MNSNRVPVNVNVQFDIGVSERVCHMSSELMFLHLLYARNQIPSEFRMLEKRLAQLQKELIQSDEEQDISKPIKRSVQKQKEKWIQKASQVSVSVHEVRQVLADIAYGEGVKEVMFGFGTSIHNLKEVYRIEFPGFLAVEPVDSDKSLLPKISAPLMRSLFSNELYGKQVSSEIAATKLWIMISRDTTTNWTYEHNDKFVYEEDYEIPVRAKQTHIKLNSAEPTQVLEEESPTDFLFLEPAIPTLDKPESQTVNSQKRDVFSTPLTSKSMQFRNNSSTVHFPDSLNATPLVTPIHRCAQMEEIMQFPLIKDLDGTVNEKDVNTTNNRTSHDCLTMELTPGISVPRWSTPYKKSQSYSHSSPSKYLYDDMPSFNESVAEEDPHEWFLLDIPISGFKDIFYENS